MGMGGGTVIMRVFEGGEGCVSGGRVERSRERGVGVLCVGGLAEGEVGGEDWEAGMVAMGGMVRGVATTQEIEYVGQLSLTRMRIA